MSARFAMVFWGLAEPILLRWPHLLLFNHDCVVRAPCQPMCSHVPMAALWAPRDPLAAFFSVNRSVAPRGPIGPYSPLVDPTASHMGRYWV